MIVKWRTAKIDLMACYGAIEARSSRAADRSLLNVEVTFAALALTPGIGSPYKTKDPRLGCLRCFPVKRFKNHVVFYLPMNKGIEVVRVMHAARNLDEAFDWIFPEDQ